MNVARRKEIDALIKQFEEDKETYQALVDALEKAKEAAEELKGDIESVRDDEQEYYDNMPESLQGGDRGQSSQAAIEQLDAAIESLNGITDLDIDFDVDSVITALDEAKAS